MRRSARDDAEFTEFVAARSDQLYRSAYLLTTAPHAAEDLLQTTLTKTYVGWRRVRAADDPVGYAHGILVKSFLSERRLRRSGELPVAETPEPPPYFLATLVGPGGGHVEFYAAEGTRDDRPGTVHDPADRPPFTMDEVVELLTNPVWTSYDG